MHTIELGLHTRGAIALCLACRLCVANTIRGGARGEQTGHHNEGQQFFHVHQTFFYGTQQHFVTLKSLSPTNIRKQLRSKIEFQLKGQVPSLVLLDRPSGFGYSDQALFIIEYPYFSDVCAIVNLAFEGAVH